MNSELPVYQFVPVGPPLRLCVNFTMIRATGAIYIAPTSSGPSTPLAADYPNRRSERRFSMLEISQKGAVQAATRLRHTVPLGLLAPAVVELICAGRQVASVTAERLKAHHNLALDWNAQRAHLEN